MSKHPNPIRGHVSCPVCSSHATVHRVGEGKLIAEGEPTKNGRNLGLLYYKCPSCNKAVLNYARFWLVHLRQSAYLHPLGERWRDYYKPGTKRAHELGLGVYSSATASTSESCSMLASTQARYFSRATLFSLVSCSMWANNAGFKPNASSVKLPVMSILLARLIIALVSMSLNWLSSFSTLALSLSAAAGRAITFVSGNL